MNRFRHNFAKFKAAGEIRRVEYDMLKKDGSGIAVAIDGKIGRDREGKFKQTHCIVHDLTELKRSHQELEESRERLSLALDGASLGIWDWDLKAGRAFWTARTLDMLGYEANEFEANLKNWKRIVHPDDWPRVSENLNLHIQGKAPKFEAEYRIRDKSGDWRWSQVKGSVVEYDESQKPVRMTGVVVDITDRKKAEEAQKESQQSYRTLVEESFDGILLQRGTKIVLANSPLHNMLGYEPGELIGKDHWTIYHPDDQPITRARAQARLRGEDVPESYEVRLQSKEGTVLDGEIRAKTFFFEEKPGIQVWVRDISEQKRSKEKFQTLIENVPFGTVIIEDDGTYSYLSPQVVDMFGYAPEDIPDGSTWMRMAYPDSDYRKEVIAAWVTDMHGVRPGEQRPRVFTVTCKDETKKYVHFRPVQLRTGEHLMTLEDITDRKRAEDELKRLNGALKTLSECNQALVRAQDETTLVEDVCRILVEQGGYRMAWIGFAEQDKSKMVRPVAQAGFEEGYLNTLNITWSDTDRGRSPTGIAIRTREPVVTRYLPVESGFDHLREDALKRGCVCFAALPLKRDEKVLGAMNLYAAEEDAFDVEEMKLLAELADDLAYGITALRIQMERDWAETQRREAHQRLLDIIEFLPDATFVIDEYKRIVAWNKACEAMTGVKKQALLGQGDYAYAEPFFGEPRPILIDLLDLRNDEIEATYKYVSRKDHLIFAESFIPRLRDGQGAHLWGVAAPLFDQEGRRCGAIEVIRDVTEQKHIEQVLRESELKYRTLFESAGDAILVMHHDRFVDCNSRALTVFGCSRDEIIGAPPYEFSPPTQPDGRRSEDKALEKINLALTEGAHLFEWEHRRRDGTAFMADVSLNRIDLDDQALIQAIVRDITDRKKAEERLMDSERKYRELVQNANSIILRWTRDGRITFLNEFGQKFFGYSADEILGRHVLGTIVPVTDSIGRDLGPLMDQILADPEAFEQNINENMKRDGERVVIAWTNKIVPEQQGETAEVLSIGVDITELTRAQAQIQQRNEELRAINRIVSTASGFLDLEAVLEEVLDEALNLVGLEGGTICLVAPDGTLELHARRAANEAAVRNLSTGSIRVGDCLCGPCVHTLEPFILCDREELRAYSVPESTQDDPIHFHAAFPLVAANKCVGVLCVFTGTERKPLDERLKLLETITGQLALAIENAQLYEALQCHAAELEKTVTERTRELALAKERAEAADRLKSAFLATMSHELRTPLNSIIGFTGIVLQGLAGPLNPEQSKQLEMVRSSSRHLLALINDVLDISKIEAGQLEIACAPFELRESINKVLGIVAPLAEKKGLKLNADVAPEVNEAVGDQRRVEQILLNLLNNAVKFTDEGKVALKAEMILDFRSPSRAHAQPAVRMSVSDTGIGIKPDDLATLFQPFRQIETGLSRNYEGTGLGLAICRRLVNLMGGEIGVDSAWMKGSTFSVTLPL